jgi:hypothetical protein
MSKIQNNDEESTEEEKNVTKTNKIILELGDIIQLTAPSNSLIHEETFFIIYLDDQKIKLANVSTFHPYTLNLDEDGKISDESIKEIALLSRSEEKGYARQHMLLPRTWINIHFGGEVPTIITGEITNLEEDMIEITSYPDMDVLYIDFSYKGIPETIPLDQIEIRAKPASLFKIASLLDIRDDMEEGELVDDQRLTDDDIQMEYSDMGEMTIRMPKNAKADDSIKETLTGMYLDANELLFGEELEGITKAIEIPEYKKKFGIETQVNDMMDELLSNIPVFKRSKDVMDNIHYLIERFRELRIQFSKFDANGNVYDKKIVGNLNKPLADRIEKLNTRLKWILPVVSMRKKVYTAIQNDTIDDVVQYDMLTELQSQEVLHEDYFKNKPQGDSSKYSTFYERLDPFFTPMLAPAFPDNFLAPKQTVSEEMETIVDNLDDFLSTVYTSNKKEGYLKRKFVIQRYNLGLTNLSPTTRGNFKSVYIRNELTPNDSLTIKSLLVLPRPVLQFSSIDLPGVSILQKCAYSLNPLFLFRLLQKNTDVEKKTVQKFNHDYDIEYWESDDFSNKIQEFVLDDSLMSNSKRFHRFLESFAPSVNAVLKLMNKYNLLKGGYSIETLAKTLEPFYVYSADVTYNHFKYMRFIIKKMINDLKVKIVKRGDEFSRMRTLKSSTLYPHLIKRVLHENKELESLFNDMYKFSKEDTNSSSEFVSKILEYDNGKLFGLLIQFAMSSLVTPENLIQALDPDDDADEMSKAEKIKAKDCSVRYLTKRYTSLKDLQKDNGNAEIYYDEEFDETPYDIMNKYKNDRPKYSAADFLDYMIENLEQKHDCPPKLSRELAESLIAGKKLIKDGEYALLEFRPKLPANMDEMNISKADLKQMEIESNSLKKTQYYKRVKNQWVNDHTIQEGAFVDNNTLFCNMRDVCFKDRNTKQCDALPTAEERMKQLARKQIIKEFDGRFAESLEELKEGIKGALEQAMKDIKKMRILHEIQRNKQNNYAFELSKFVKVEELNQSPYVVLREFIFGQDDFVKKNIDIMRFVDMFCREPMAAELDENPYWLYCKETNTKLLPAFHRDLAAVFVKGGNYQQKLDEICRRQGTLSDDGDSIVDLHSGYVIKIKELVEEDTYDDSGFKVVTNDFLEKDAGDALLSALGKTKDRVFESENANMVFGIFSTIMRNIGINPEDLEETVLRMSLELVEKHVDPEAVYKRKSEELEKKNGKRLAPYKSYKNQAVLTIVAAVLLVSVQSAIPSFKTRKTFPGCVQSFSGFPLGGAEDMSGLKYITCVMKKSASAFEPWNSIEKMPVEILQSRIETVLSKYLLTRTDIVELFSKKNEYIALHPHEFIPEEHAIQKWVHFMPPVVPFTVKKGLKGLTAEYKNELVSLLRDGKQQQRDHISIFKTKTLQYSYGIIESISDIVQAKDVLLNTVSKVPFLENSCCNDRESITTLGYFAAQDETILPHLKMISGWSAVLENVKDLSKASLLYHNKPTGVKLVEEVKEHFEMNVYAAFIHYCNLDNDLPIPEEVRGLMSEKPEGYNQKSTIQEKVEFLKENGKRYTLGNLLQLMEIVNSQNIVGIYNEKLKGTPISAMKEFIEYLETQEQSPIETPLLTLLSAVVEKFDAKKMINVNNPSKENMDLNKYLSRANTEMFDAILQFLKTNGNMNRLRTEKVKSILANIHIWDMDSDIHIDSGMYNVLQFMKTSVYNMSRLYPELIRNNYSENTKIPKRWGLSSIHERDLASILKKEYESLQKFKNDPLIVSVLTAVQIKLVDLNTFLNIIPLFSQVHKEDVASEESVKPILTWYSLFSKRTLYLLFTYIWYSVLLEFVEISNDPEMVQMDVVNRRKQRSKKITENEDSMNAEDSVLELDENTDMAETADDLDEVQIEMGNQMELKSHVAELLVTFLEIENKTKESVDFSYVNLDAKLRRSRIEEKKLITDYLRDMDNEERRVEDTKKSLKLGRWNVGMQKGLVNYDDATYERERNEMIARLSNEGAVEDESDLLVLREVEDLDKEGVEGEDGDFGIDGLDEDYNDGVYYAEDAE